MKEWSIKKKRIVIGILMMYAFMSVIFTSGFFLNLGSIIDTLLAFVVFHYFWLPSILLILLSYHVLTKVYKYEGDDK